MDDPPKPGDVITFLHPDGSPGETRAVLGRNAWRAGDDASPYVLHTIAGSWWLHDEGIYWRRGPPTRESTDALRAAIALTETPGA